MKLDLKIEPLIEKDFTEMASLFNRFAEDLSKRKDRDYTPFTPEYAKYDFERNLKDNGILLGIYLDEKLVGTIGASLVPVTFQGVEMLSGGITYYSMDPEVQPMIQEAQKQIFQSIIDKIQEAKADFIWVVFDASTNSKEEKIFKTDFQFIKMNSNVEPLTKLLGSRGVDIIKAKKDLNPVLAQLAKLMAKMQKMPLPGGEIRDVTPDDYPRIVELLNSYSKTVDIAQIWTLDQFKNLIEVNEFVNQMDHSALFAEFPDAPCGSFLKVWEREGKIIAAIGFRILAAAFKNGLAPLVYWDNIAISQDLELEEKRAFVVNLYNEYLNKATTITAFFPSYESRVLGKSGFMSSQMKTPLYILPITEKGKKILELTKIKSFYLPYREFLV